VLCSLSIADNVITRKNIGESTSKAKKLISIEKSIVKER